MIEPMLRIEVVRYQGGTSRLESEEEELKEREWQTIDKQRLIGRIVSSFLCSRVLTFVTSVSQQI